MNDETRKLDELYLERDARTEHDDAATKRDLEGLAHAIGEFRSAVHAIAAREMETQQPLAWQMERARVRMRSRQRRVMLEWAVAAALCVAALVPAADFYREHTAAVRAREQAQMQRQRQADEALLDQVNSELSEAVPDSMQPLAEMDSDYASSQAPVQGTGIGGMEKQNGRN